MKAFILSILVGLMMVQVAAAQTGSNLVSLDIMATAVHAESIHSVPLKVSIPGEVNSSEVTFQLSDDVSGKIFITGTPYDSLGVNLPPGVLLSNQYGETAELHQLRLLYGATDDQSKMDVSPPSGCAMIQVPTTGRIYLRMGGELTSKRRLRGTFTGRMNLSCDKEP